MHRTWAIIERELRRFRRSPMLIVMSMIFPLLQLVVLGYAFGGNVKHLKLAIVDQDHGVPAVKIRELAGAVSAGARTLDLLEYADPGHALTDLRNGVVNGVLEIPPDFSRRALTDQQPRVALISDNTDTFVSATLARHREFAWSPPSTHPSPWSASRRLRRPRRRRGVSRTCPTFSTCCRARSPCRSS